MKNKIDIAYKIPPEDEHSEEFIDFLHEMPNEWESERHATISVKIGDEFVMGSPGDWVVKLDNGFYTLMTEEEYREQTKQEELVS